MLDYEIPGIAEAIRAHRRDRVPTAALSRGLAGVAGRTLVVNLPGSTGGAKDGLAVLGPILRARGRPAPRRRPLSRTAAVIGSQGERRRRPRRRGESPRDDAGRWADGPRAARPGAVAAAPVAAGRRWPRPTG